MGKFGKENFEEGNCWRVYCKEILENYECDYKVKAVNPNDYFSFKDDTPTYDNQREIMEFDLNKVRNADLIIVNFNDVYSLGSMSEIAIAYERKIPVIGINLKNQDLHPWQIEMSYRIFNNIEKMLEYVKEKYLMQRGANEINYIGTSHALARELLNKPDSFLAATNGDKEFVIENIRKISTQANIDDSVSYWVLNLRECTNGNIKR